MEFSVTMFPTDYSIGPTAPAETCPAAKQKPPLALSSAGAGAF